MSAAGVVAAFPFRDYFWGGVLFSACNAATIGGLADSFAVGALFGNPLKIKWPAFMGTRVIARNRERLIGELGNMVQYELLTTANIQARLSEYSISAILIDYLRKHGGQEDITEIAERLAKELMVKMDVQELANALHELLFGSMEALQASDIAADVADWIVRNGYDEPIIDFLIHELIKIVHTERFRLVIERLADSVLSSYESGKFRRQFVNIAAGLEASSLSGKIQLKIASFLKEMLSPSHAQRIKLKEQMGHFVLRLRSDPDLRDSIERGKLRIINAIKGHVQLDAFVREILNFFLQLSKEDGATGGGKGTALYSWIDRKIEQGIGTLENNEDLLQAIDRYIKKNVLMWIEQRHGFIAQVVTDKLNTYSEQQLIGMVQDKAGPDLQYIRLNGIGIGGLIGAFLYLITFWIGGLTG
nr:DUF445 domain-containing protein [Paenibacillus caui]